MWAFVSQDSAPAAASSLPRVIVEWQQFGSRFWQWTQGKTQPRTWRPGSEWVIFLVTIICARVASFPFAGIMLTARLPSHSSELSTSADAASCSETTPSVALSQGCAGSTWSCAVSCWPCATGRCLSRAASGPAACVAPVPRWTAWRSDSMKRDSREERIGRNVVGDGI